MHLHRKVIRGACLVVLCAFAAFWFFSAFQRRIDRVSLSPGQNHGTQYIGSGLRYIFAPRALVDFARTHQPPDDFEELVSELKSAGLGDSWYVIVGGSLIGNGTRTRIVICVHPSRMPSQFARPQQVLEVIRNADEARPDRVADGKSDVLKIIPDEIARQDPATVVHDLTEGAR